MPNTTDSAQKGAAGSGCPAVLSLNGAPVPICAGDTIFDVCARAGVSLPAMCRSERLAPIGSCRLCLVEVDGIVSASCATLANANQRIQTNTPRAERLRKTNLELLAASISAEAAAELQEWLRLYGVESSISRPAVTPPAPSRREHTHPYIREQYERCTVCLRCVDACKTLAHRNVFEIRGSSLDLHIRPVYPENWIASGCVTCGACVEECPTGALTAPELFLPGALPLPSDKPEETKRDLELRIAAVPAGAREGLCIHPEDAAPRKIVDEQFVEIKSGERGSRMKAILTARTPLGVVTRLCCDTSAHGGLVGLAVRLRGLNAAEAALPPDDSFELRGPVI